MNVWAPGTQFCDYYLNYAVSSLTTYALLIYLLYLTAASQQHVDQPTHISLILLLAPAHSSVWCWDNIIIWFNLICLAFTQATPKTIFYVKMFYFACFYFQEGNFLSRKNDVLDGEYFSCTSCMCCLLLKQVLWLQFEWRHSLLVALPQQGSFPAVSSANSRTSAHWIKDCTVP